MHIYTSLVLKNQPNAEIQWIKWAALLPCGAHKYRLTLSKLSFPIYNIEYVPSTVCRPTHDFVLACICNGLCVKRSYCKRFLVYVRLSAWKCFYTRHIAGGNVQPSAVKLNFALSSQLPWCKYDSRFEGPFLHPRRSRKYRTYCPRCTNNYDTFVLLSLLCLY